ncbi:sugar nucleotide-binding protein [Microbulbifer yueqingensis]|uniref:dTDP-4-dehydrorhamnose reductase n=1 Tax=Microbulbifer yueqingensis TaxID=658219 RepID=A0A1G9ETS3_9GAMM|nr:sugar nucleotide-binding protein [Microbulbifer yueqingensis]SDK79504.1 dTDP-4-dehydrorhamnose reductase [Microbulbifer yueqingensis]
MPDYHTGYQPDSVAVIGAGNFIDGPLQKRLQRVGFRVQLLAPSELDQLRTGAIVINAACCAGSDTAAQALQVCRDLAARDDYSHLVHISSYQVFAGGARKRYDEDDEPNADSDTGRHWLACEEALAGCRNLTILRFGWMVDRSENALLARVLRALLSQQSIAVDDESRGSPVTVADMVRVMVAVVQQLASGAPPAGTYHYGAADSCTALEFAREAIERAQSFLDEGSPVEPEPLPEPSGNRSAVLASGKLRDVFGIQQRSWRQGLTRQVELWLERLGNGQ